LLKLDWSKTTTQVCVILALCLPVEERWEVMGLWAKVIVLFMFKLKLIFIFLMLVWKKTIGFNMKFVSNFFDFVVRIFSKIPVYLRGLVIFFILVFISVLFNRINTPDYIVDNGPEYVILKKPVANDSGNYIDANVKNDLNRKVEINENDDSVRVRVEENLKSDSPSIKTPNRRNGWGKGASVSDSHYLTSFINDYVMGDKSAPVSVVEYSSFKCPYCVDFYQENMDKIKTNYIDTGKVKYVRRVVIQKDTLLGVMLLHCAKDGYKYAIMNDLFNTANVWTKPSTQSKNLKEIALKNGFTADSYDACIKDEKLANRLLAKQELELKDLKIYSTPTIFIDGERQRGIMSYSEFSKKLDEAILKSKEKNS